MQTGPRRALDLILAVILTASVVALTHRPVLDSQALALDDTVLVRDNPLVTHPSWTSAAGLFGEALNPSAGDRLYKHVIPLSMTSLMLDYALGGRPSDLRVFHRTNLALHILNTVLVLLILYRLFGALLPAVAVALMFGLHPLTTEPVASVGERKTLLAACFAFACVLCYLQYCRRGGHAWWTPAVALFVLAMLSKPSVTTLPLLLLLLDYWPLRRLSWSTVIEKLPLVFLSLVFVVINVLAVVRTWEFGTPPESSVLRSGLQICYLLAFYLGKIVWPTNLSCVYVPPEFVVANRDVILSLVTVGGFITILLLSARRTRGLIAGSLFFVLALAPTFGILKWSWSIASDRYVYLPMLGILLVLGSGVAAAWRSRPFRSLASKAALMALLSVIISAEAWGTRSALRHWKDSITLWRHVVTLAPQTAEAHNGLGVAFEAQSLYGEAIHEFRRATELGPGHADAHSNLGVLLSRSGQADEAIRHLRWAAALQPGSPGVVVQLGMAQQRAGRMGEAELQFRRALEIRPGYIDALDQFGILHVLQGRPDEGLRLIRGAIELAPQDARPRFSLAMALLHARGHDAEVVDLLRQAIAFKPDWAAPCNELAWIMATSPVPALRDPSEALRLADRAVALTGGRDASALDTQAAAFAAAGQFEQAMRGARSALAIARQGVADPSPQAIQARLALYERRIPYTEPAGVAAAADTR